MDQLGFVFPGQGSQKLAILEELAELHPEVGATFAEASEVLQRDLWEIAQVDSENLLDRTDITQPILLTASIAIWRVWQAQGGAMPLLFAGHSLGEYSALVCAEVVSFRDAVTLVNRRGLYMQNAVPPGLGKMAAIVGLDNDAIEKACQEALARACGELPQPPVKSSGFAVPATHAGSVVILIYRVRFLSSVSPGPCVSSRKCSGAVGLCTRACLEGS